MSKESSRKFDGLGVCPCFSAAVYCVGQVAQHRSEGVMHAQYVGRIVPHSVEQFWRVDAGANMVSFMVVCGRDSHWGTWYEAVRLPSAIPVSI